MSRKHRLLAFGVMFFMVGCGGADAGQEPTDWIIVPGERVGPVTASTGHRALSELFGDSAVVSRPYYIGEGFCVPGAVLFADADDELEIAWQDSGHTRISTVATLRPGGRWVTTAGIRVGTTLAELEELNGGPFTFSGFGWDYGGGLGSWEGGELTTTHTDGIRFRFDADNDSLLALGGGRAVDALHGEQMVRSDHPSAQRAGIAVTDIAVVFGPLPAEEFCG